MDVKICGLTQSRDVVKAVALGATHVGCVVVPGTPRAVSAETAGELLRDSGAAPVLAAAQPDELPLIRPEPPAELLLVGVLPEALLRVEAPPWAATGAAVLHMMAIVKIMV